eukprot:scaffold105145_cov40-Prasinocladus_malaysianus.AAC.1
MHSVKHVSLYMIVSIRAQQSLSVVVIHTHCIYTELFLRVLHVQAGGKSEEVILLDITGMKCGGCVSRVKRALECSRSTVILDHPAIKTSSRLFEA